MQSSSRGSSASSFLVGQQVRHLSQPGRGRITAVTDTQVYVAWDCGITMSHLASTRALRVVREVTA